MTTTQVTHSFGAGKTGTVTFRASGTIIDYAGKTRYPATGIVAPLDSNGDISVPLVPTQLPGNPSRLVYVVTEEIDGAPGTPYLVKVPVEGPVDLLGIKYTPPTAEVVAPSGGGGGGTGDVSTAQLNAAIATVNTVVATKQNIATAATDTELTAAVSTIQAALDSGLLTKQDASSAATDTEVASAVATINAAMANKQDAATAATDAEVAAAVATINTAVAANTSAIANSIVVVNSGADPNFARPAGAAVVYWKCTVDPVNAIAGDLINNASA